MEIYSYGRVSKNENGHEEVSIEFFPSFLQTILWRPGTKKVWFRVGDHWLDKSTDKLASNKDLLLISSILYNLSKQDCI